ncbi:MULTISPECIES: DUF2325 domain-containing protein [Propionispora]|jgi:hypothetical protein|uniref:Dihydroorotate dehydrogenase n=2 Tax=Propionispora TaxID=112902 RepID=A0A1H8X6W2_9FIRM|nr:MULTISPECIES: DUF2325 domain-containing protein [Propionispora]SEP35453.1 hypothetical protein SAMN04490178_12084 [Propionispora vibrioides]SHJ78138.1 hypothetical protein SAMN02745170_03307 [Propionispora hippei DSM 15287]
MSIVIVGGDYLGNIEKNLYAMGVKELTHISGRKPIDRNKIKIPQSTSFILVLTDYINHCTAQNVKCIAKSKSIPMVFAKRSWSSVEEKIKQLETSGPSALKA